MNACISLLFSFAITAYNKNVGKNKHDLKTSLADGDAEKCMEGTQCVSLGIEIKQLRANIEYLWMSDGNKRI